MEEVPFQLALTHRRAICDKFVEHDAVPQGKKRFHFSYRPLQSKINLKFSDSQCNQDPNRKQKVFVDQSKLEKFEIDYNNYCNVEFQRKKQRGFSPENPFNPKNVPPSSYCVPDKIIQKPNKMDLTVFDTKNVAMAGRMTELGDKILALGCKKAKHLYTGHWKELEKETKTEPDSSKFMSRRSKVQSQLVTKPNAKKFGSTSLLPSAREKCLDEEWLPADNHSHLHVKGCFHNTVFDYATDF